MRHSFKKNNNNFIIKMTEMINNKVDDKNRQKWYEVIDNIEKEKSFNLDKVEKIVGEILVDHFQESTDDIINEITNRYNNSEDTTSSGNDLEECHLMGIINEWKQIQEQSEKLIGKSTSIANNVSILKGEDESSYEIADVDNVEIIDIGLDMEEDATIFSDHEEKVNYRCVFCNSKNILIISSTEAFCNNCDKNFMIGANVLPQK